MTLEAGHYAEFEVRQRGPDIVVRVLNPVHEVVGEFDSPTGTQGTETALFIADEGGGWTVELEPFEGSPAGEYEIEWTASHPATDEDRRAVRLVERSAEAERLDGEVVRLYRAGMYSEAIPRAERALAIREELLGAQHPEVATSLNNLARLYRSQGRYAEAEPLYERAFAIREAALGPEHPDVATSLSNLARLYQSQGRYAEAEPLYERALAIREAELGAEHPYWRQSLNNLSVAWSLNNLAALYRAQGRYAEAEPLYERALRIQEEVLGPEDPEVATSLNNLAVLYRAQGRYAEAEPLYERALAIREAARGGEHPEVANSLNNLGLLYTVQGRYADAEPLHERALAIREAARGAQHPNLATSLSYLAALYWNQGRYAEAEPLFERALAIREAALGPEHPDVATSLNNLAVLYWAQGRYAEAEPLYERSLAIWEAAFGSEHPDVATSLHNLARLYGAQGRYAEAEPLYERSLAIWEAALGAEHPYVAQSLNNLALLYRAQGRYAEAGPLVARAIRIYDGTPGNPEGRVFAYANRARIAKATDDLDGAIVDLEEALESLEDLRPQVGGGERVRAGFFERHSDLFDLMVRWQLEAGDVEAALEWSERGRARVLLDQLAAGKVDLRASIPADIRRPLEERETRALARLTEYQQRITLLRSRTDLTDDQRIARIEVLEDSLALADDDFRQVYRDIKNASPLLRDQLGPELVSLRDMQRRLVPDGGLILLYEAGPEASHVFVVPRAREGEVEVLPLTVSEAKAEILGVEAGPLTSSDLERLVLGDAEEGGGVVPSARGLEVAAAGSTDYRRLQAVREVLVPDELWERIRVSEEVVLIPDGALHELPFEALVVAGGPDAPRFWLDEGPPIRYATSASSLDAIERRPSVRIGAPGPGAGVLSVSDPVYDPAEVARALQDAGADPGEAADATPTASDVTRNSYVRAGGSLVRLPGTALETDALLDAFGADRAMGEVAVLRRLEAREARTRRALAGKRYLHLATHGLVDERRGDLFASLAFTPPAGEEATSADDGFLQLHEIYGLELGEVELAVLSACDTNVGERVEGEGVFALSRGFLASGARRVVASQWQVDDASTAAIVGAFFTAIAEAERAGERVDYAQALRDAKLAVRNDPDHPEWGDPYYWAPFVLTGKR